MPSRLPAGPAPSGMPPTRSKKPSWIWKTPRAICMGKGGKKPIGTVAREAVQMAEDARIITIKKMEEETSGERAPGGRGPRIARRERTGRGAV